MSLVYLQVLFHFAIILYPDGSLKKFEILFTDIILVLNKSPYFIQNVIVIKVFRFERRTLCIFCHKILHYYWSSFLMQRHISELRVIIAHSKDKSIVTKYNNLITFTTRLHCQGRPLKRRALGQVPVLKIKTTEILKNSKL